MKLAAIDIGSNAVRLLICRAHQTADDIVLKKEELLRIPIRLGEDVFINGNISDEKSNRLIKAMKAFKNVMELFDVEAFRACATSAMRDASNSAEVIAKIKSDSEIDIELLSGGDEARLIYENHIADHFSNDYAYLYIDVGGGSTELTLYSKSKMVFSRSFDIGTIRYLFNQVSKETLTDFKQFIKYNTEEYQPIIAIGSGGNINKIEKILDKKGSRSLTFEKISDLYDELKGLTIEQRMEKYGMKSDRADVIVPAAKIFMTVMKYAGIHRIVIPEIGLADGIIHRLFEERQKFNA